MENNVNFNLAYFGMPACSVNSATFDITTADADITSPKVVSSSASVS